MTNNPLQEWLKARGLTQRWLAEQCGVSQPAVWRWVQPGAVPPPNQRCLIERATNGEVPESIWGHILCTLIPEDHE
jgi:transcriptional regulator with XRE-family HTH domain